MTVNQLPPDVIGHMAGLGNTNDPLEACHSCQRAVIYATLAHIASAGASLSEGSFLSADKHLSYATSTLLELAKLDFAGVVPDSDDMEEEDWKLAMMAFYQSRVEHYVDEGTGLVKFEPHDEDGEPAGVGA